MKFVKNAKSTGVICDNESEDRVVRFLLLLEKSPPDLDAFLYMKNNKGSECFIDETRINLCSYT